MKKQILDKIIKDLPFGYAFCQFIKDEKGKPCDYIFMDVNNQYADSVGLFASDILGKKVSEVLPNLIEDEIDWIKKLASVAYEGQEIQFEQYFKRFNKWYRVYAYSPEKAYFVLLFKEISGEKRNKAQLFEAQQVLKRQEAIIDIYNQNFSSQQEFLDYALHRALGITGSEYGYIFDYDEDSKKFISNAWTIGVMDDCKVKNKQAEYQLDKTGIWGEVVRQRKPIVINDFKAQHPLKKGHPAGHVGILNYISVPVFHGGRIVAAVGLANKKSHYTQFDVNQLTLFMQSAWLIKENKRQMQTSEIERGNYYEILNKIPALICTFDKNGILEYVNDMYSKYFGYEEKTLIGKSYLDFVPQKNKKEVKDSFLALTKENPVAYNVYQVEKGKRKYWIEWQNIAFFNEQGFITKYYSVGMDITDKQSLEIKEKEELEMFKSAVESHSIVMLLLEPETGKILYVNPAAIEFYGYSREELLKMFIQDINMLGEEQVKELRLKASKKSQRYFTFPHLLKSGEIRMVDVYTGPIYYENKKVLFSIVFDVTDKEEAMKEIKQLAYHDYLTGVYNRRYFEGAFSKLDTEQNRPLAIISGDINGIKMINDNFGYKVGDELIKEAAKSIQSLIPKDCMIARIGGDEFAILLTNASESQVVMMTNMLENELEKYVKLKTNGKSEVYLSVSFGYGIQNIKEHTLDKLMTKAENHIYRRKYYNLKSMRSNMIKAMMSTLFQKSEREQKHSLRVSRYCEAIAKELGWDTDRVNIVKIAGSLHDIGKIGISEAILNKKGKLDKEEWEIMKQHPLKSAKILEETEEYRGIVDIVEAHHERWDGSGYPRGLEGEKIPIIARVIAVVDAYDAMTSFRSYRKPVNKKEAIAELKKHAGTQFDSSIVDVFVNRVLKNETTTERIENKIV